ncbi:MAG: response regulator [Deltaproteobacteria bacterium]|nr:response regulator [Deltaproteobacteria bacterium]
MINSLNKICPRKRILIVEDNKMHSELLKIIVQSSFDADITVAEDGKDALDKITAGYIFDLIIIDIMLPKINGLDVLKTIRKVYDKVPILMLSALNDKETIDKSYAEGATDYVAKPIRNGLLKDKISFLLGGGGIKPS